MLGNDEDMDGDALTIVGVTDGIYGDVIIQGSEVGYLRDTDGPAVFPGDSFTYTVEDPSGARSTATVTIASETPPPSEVTVTRQVTFDGEQGGTKGFDTAPGRQRRRSGDRQRATAPVWCSRTWRSRRARPSSPPC